MAASVVLRDITLLDGSTVDIWVDKARIAAISSSGNLPAAKGNQDIHCHGGLGVRPFSEPHIHIDKAGTALLADRVPRTITEAIATMAAVKKEAARDPAAIRDRIQRIFERLLKAGTYHARALVDVDETWELTAFNAVRDVRERLRGRIDVRIEVFPQEGLTPVVANLMRQAADMGADAIGAHTDLDEDYMSALRTAAKIAREKRLPLQVHVDEAASPSSFRMPKVLEIAGDLDQLALAHCLSLATLQDEDQHNWARRLSEAGARVVVAPSVLSFGLPMAPVEKLLDSGVNVLVGSDNLQDVFVPLGSGRLLESVRTVALVQRLIDPEKHKALLSGVTNAAYAFVTNERAELEVESPASLMVFTGRDARAVLLGDDAIRLTMINGEIRRGEQI